MGPNVSIAVGPNQVVKRNCDNAENNNDQSWFKSSHLDPSANGTSITLDTRRVRVFGQLLKTGDSAQNPCARHFEWYGDLSPTSAMLFSPFGFRRRQLMSNPGRPKYVIILFATSVLFMSATFLPFLDSILFPNDEIARFVNAPENRGEVPLDAENADTVVEQMKSTLGFMNKAIQVGCGYRRMVQYDLKRVKPPIKVSVTEYVYIAWFQKLQKPTLISVALYSSEAGQHAFQISTPMHPVCRARMGFQYHYSQCRFS